MIIVSSLCCRGRWIYIARESSFKTTINNKHGDKLQKHRVGCVLHPKEAYASDQGGILLTMNHDLGSQTKGQEPTIQ